jgi:hypothetical protein
LSLISDIEAGVLTRLEEPASPVFWDLTNELRMLVVEGMFEACILTGEVQVKQTSTPFSLAANTTFFNVPAGVFSIIRMEVGGQPVRKVSMWDLDLDRNNWQQDTKLAAPTEWFPLGLNLFGIRPQLTAPVNATLTVVQYPVTAAPPYTGAEAVPFQSEFNIGLEMYAGHRARLKEGGAEMDSGMFLYEGFLSSMAELSLFALRKDSLRFSKTVGTEARVDSVEKK